MSGSKYRNRNRRCRKFVFYLFIHSDGHTATARYMDVFIVCSFLYIQCYIVESNQG